MSLNSEEKNTAYEKLTPQRKQLVDKVMENLEKGNLFWTQGWVSSGAPESAITGKKYRGINNLFLSLIAMSENYGDNRWATFKQMEEKGWTFKKDEEGKSAAKGKGATVEYYEMRDKETKKRFDRSVLDGMTASEQQEYMDKSKDIWSRKLKCRCGYRMRRNKWHKNKSGEVIYGYKCYNQLNNGSKAIRDSVGVESEKACDLREICDWKFEMMARHIFSGLWGNKKDILNEVSSLYRVNSRENKMETDREKSELDKEIAKIDAKMRRLTQMRLDDELPKNEYLEFKSDLESKRNALVLNRSKLNSKTETDPDGLTEGIQEFLLAKMNFTEHCIDRDVISQFVTTIIPRTETCFEWYLNFDLIDKPNEEKKMVWEFPIEFQEAKSYRTEVNSLLRPTQWQDLLVRVYV